MGAFCLELVDVALTSWRTSGWPVRVIPRNHRAEVAPSTPLLQAFLGTMRRPRSRHEYARRRSIAEGLAPAATHDGHAGGSNVPGTRRLLAAACS
jgi:hypothetical protein